MTEYLNISLSRDENINRDILVVCREITAQYKKLIPFGPPLGQKLLYVIYNPSMPITFLNGLPHYYMIGLTTNERYYTQIAYQFAHELTHIYCDPRITNWFIESICEMAALYFLDYLSIKWSTNPPFKHWRDYAMKFSDYKYNIIEEVKSKFSIKNDQELQSTFISIIRTINEPFNRNYNTIIALKLSKLFKDNNAWLLLRHIGKSTDKILNDYSFYGNSTPDFDKLIAYSPDNIKNIARRIKSLMKIGV